MNTLPFIGNHSHHDLKYETYDTPFQRDKRVVDCHIENARFTSQVIDTDWDRAFVQGSFSRIFVDRVREGNAIFSRSFAGNTFSNIMLTNSAVPLFDFGPEGRQEHHDANPGAHKVSNTLNSFQNIRMRDNEGDGIRLWFPQMIHRLWCEDQDGKALVFYGGEPQLSIFGGSFEDIGDEECGLFARSGVVRTYGVRWGALNRGQWKDPKKRVLGRRAKSKYYFETTDHVLKDEFDAEGDVEQEIERPGSCFVIDTPINRGAALAMKKFNQQITNGNVIFKDGVAWIGYSHVIEYWQKRLEVWGGGQFPEHAVS